MAVALAGQAGATDAVGSVTTLDVVRTTAAGNLLVLFVSWLAGDSTTISVADTGGGNTWTKASKGDKSGSTGTRAEIWYAINAAAITKVTVTQSVASIKSAVLAEFSGFGTGSLELGDTNTTGGTATPALTNTLTPTAGDLIVAAMNLNNTAAITFVTTGSWVALTAQGTLAGNRCPPGYKLSGTTSESESWTFASGTKNWGATIAAFQPASGGSNLTRTASDSLAITDSPTRIWTGFRSVAESLAVADAASRLGTFARTAPDSLAVTDSAARIATLHRAAVDALGIGDVPIRTGIFARASADSIAVTDSAGRIATLLRAAADSLALTDLATRVAGKARSTADSLAVTDTATRQATLARSSSDAIAISDAVSRAATLRRTVTETLQITDAATRQFSVVRSVADALGITDSATRSVSAVRSASDSLGITDLASRAVAALRSAADALAITDAATGVKNGGVNTRSAADSLGISDLATRIFAGHRSTADSLTVTDTVATSSGLPVIGGLGPALRGILAAIPRAIAAAVRPRGSGGAAREASPTATARSDRPRGEARKL